MSDQHQGRFSDPGVFIPFILVTLIWGSTWIVIKDQLAVVPPGWSVTYRFTLAGLVMLLVALFSRQSIDLGKAGFGFAALLGVAQFTFNFNFVYLAEHYVTSGLVALIFALLFVPNAVFSRIFLGTPMSARFKLGSAISIAGLALLFVNEGAGAGDKAAIITGIGLTLCAIICASIANVMQATQRAKSLPMFSMIGWSMLWGAAFDGCAAWATFGPPVIEWRLGYLAGIGYLGIMASAVAFPLYFKNIREIGPAKAAYSSVLIPVIAMVFSTLFEGYQWTWLAAIGSLIALFGMAVALGDKQQS